VPAKVNKEEISIHQVNYVLQRQPGIKPEQTEKAGRDVLERLIDQELAMQRAIDSKIDRDPRVLQEIEATRREIIARAYLHHVSEKSTRPPTEAEIKAYYDGKPLLFKERRIYNLRELAVEGDAVLMADLQALLPKAKNYQEITDFLRARKVAARIRQDNTAAENLPLALLDSVAKLAVGQSLFVPAPNGARVLTLVQSQPAPATEDQARSAIEQYLLNERKRAAVEQDLNSIRSGARIEYVGQFVPAQKEMVDAGAKPMTAAPNGAQAPGTDRGALDKGLAGLR
jgi:EpsD family peptidyl-prolyl cis-trans isomerase